MNFKIYKPDIDLKLLEEDIIVNSGLVMIEGTKKDLVINSKHILKFNTALIECMVDFTGESFTAQVRNIFTFVEEETLKQVINFPKQIQDIITPKADYSFLFFTKACESEISFQEGKIFIKEGDLVVFNTEYFVSEQAFCTNRIGIYGSITNKINQNTPALGLI